MSLSDYLSWHYSSAPPKLLEIWKNFLIFNFHFFSIKELFFHLFDPWKRLTKPKKIGFDFGEFFERVSFNLVSRVIGTIARGIIIIVGLVSALFLLLSGPLVGFFWFLIPGLTYPLYQSVKKTEKLPERFSSSESGSPKEIIKAFSQTQTGKFFFSRLDLADFPERLTSQPETSIPIPKESRTDWQKLILFLAGNWPNFSSFLLEKSLVAEDLQKVFFWYQDLKQYFKKQSQFWNLDNLLTVKPVGRDLIYGYTINLDRYSTDLTVPLPYSHHLVGRQKEAKMIEQVLSRSEGNNVVIVGEPGVGRTTIILNFARLVSEGRIQPELARKRVLELNLNQIISQAKNTQEAKALTETILDEATKAGNIILVIKHIDLYLSSEPGRSNLTEVLSRPAVGKSLQIIGTTTPFDFQKYVLPNQEFRKHFEKIEVAPPTKEEAYIILGRIAPVYEKRTKTFITYQAIREAIEKGDQYVIDLPFPEKAIDLLDEVCINISQKGKLLVGKQDVDLLLSEKTKIPLGDLQKEEKEKLINLEKILHQRIINQEEAVKQIAKAIRRARTGIASQTRPIGTFIFLGPTGVGKTETAKALASAYYGSEERMTRFDMSEYQGKDALNRAIGLVSTNQPGLLAKAIRENPFSLLLLDEIEKANFEILNLFLTILDEGYFTDVFGRKVDCRNLIIIATSNAGAEFIREKVAQRKVLKDFSKQVTEYVLQNQIFSPEFINRFDAVVVFKPLTSEHLEQIARLMLENLNQRLEPQKFQVKITEELIAKVAELGFHPEFGARPMKRLIQDKIEEQIAQKMLKGEIKKGEKINIEI